MKSIIAAVMLVLVTSSLAVAQTVVYPYPGVTPVYTPQIRSYTVPLPRVPIVAMPAPVGPPAIVGADGTYLGRLSSNPYAADSVSNPYGQYGSPYSATSITNPYSQFGSPYSPYSVTNPYATAPPVLIAPAPIVPWYRR